MPSELLLVEPAYRSAPEYLETLGPEVADLAADAGFAPDPEQRLALDLIFATNVEGRSAAFEFGVVCSRQNLKTGLFKQAALGWLYLLELPLIVWSAHEFSTAQEAFRDMTVLIESNPDLYAEVVHIHKANGSEAIELTGGRRLIFKARTKAGGRGLTGDRVVLDEAFALQPEHMGALLPTLSVRPDPQILYGSSAPLVGSHVLRGVRDRGRAGTSPRLAYLEWSAPMGGCADEKCEHAVGAPGCALDNHANWQAANPLLGRTRTNGTGLTYEYVEAERQALPPAEFARERLGWGDEPGTAEAFGPGKWEACPKVEVDVPLRALALAVSADLTRAAIGGAGVDGDIVHVKPLASGPGSEWTIEDLVGLQARHNVPVVVDSGGPAAVLIPKLKARRVKLREAKTGDVLDACAGIFKLVQDARLNRGSYPELDAAASGAVPRTVGDRWAWGRKTSTSNTEVLEAVTLASWGATTAKPAGPPLDPNAHRGAGAGAGHRPTAGAGRGMAARRW